MFRTVRNGYDVVVAGGGTAGVMAAIGASRLGARTLLVEKCGYLGGTLVLGMNFTGAVDGEGYWALGGIGRELLERIKPKGGSTAPTLDPMLGSTIGQDPEILRIELTKMSVESQVDHLLHSIVVDVVCENGSVKGIVVANKAGLELVAARCFVDCTGDADLVAKSGGQFVIGRASDNLAQPVTRIFRVAPVDVLRVMAYLAEHPEDRRPPSGWELEEYPREFFLGVTRSVTVEVLGDAIGRARRAGDYHIPRYRLGLYTFPGRNEVGINITRVHGINGTDPDQLTRAEIDTLLQMEEAMVFLRKYVPGFEGANIIAAPHSVGIRETRHILGDKTLTAADVLAGASCADEIGRCAYPLDLHDVGPGAVEMGNPVTGGGITLRKIMKSFAVPAGCLIPVGLGNVVVGGRCISATHEAAGSIRGQAPSMVTGQAAGVLAALSAQTGVSPRSVDVGTMRKALLQQGAQLGRNEQIAS